ncbi:hypothetical protein AAMO2058_000581400 [Amorphochlora amoebiformis]|uniref:Mediator of RNA polymerase II transcription subunit 6 n=1 Tax=Amorphochlora amoebiformis TaxID=1561963 RepID=A0A7S0H5X1_9EUKA
MSRPEDFQNTWRYESWIYFYDLNRMTVLDYFKHSPFYDRTCNNEVVLQQGNSQDRIYEMEGTYYEPDRKTSERDPNYFVIRKLRRERSKGRGGWRVQLLALYYVLGHGPGRGTIFCLPDMHSVLSYNLTTAIHYSKLAFKELSTRVVFNRGEEYTWDHSKQKSPKSPQDTKESKPPKLTTDSKLDGKEEQGDAIEPGIQEEKDKLDPGIQEEEDKVDPGILLLVNDVLGATMRDPDDLARLERERLQREAEARAANTQGPLTGSQ